jgi:hypothetical protein
MDTPTYKLIELVGSHRKAMRMLRKMPLPEPAKLLKN